MELTATKYKETEVGLIPEDWDLVPFDKVFTFHSTSNYSKAQMSDDDEVGCIHYGLIHAIPSTQYNLKNGTKYYVSSDQAKYDIVRDGDVIMVDASEDEEGVNKSVEVCGIGNKKYISGLHTYLLRDKNGSLADNFRGILLNSQFVKSQMLQLAVGMKVFGVSKTQLIKVKLPLPPTLTEQKTIAQVLSDMDTLIQAIEKKITKKKQIKIGMMQKLLTPKEDWEVKTLGEVGEIITGGTPPTKIQSYWDGKIPWVTPTDIRAEKNINSSERELTKEGLDVIRKLPPDTLLVTCIASIGKNAILRKAGACNQQINAIVPNDSNDVDFLYYLIENNASYIKGRAGITATLMISKKDFSEITFVFPKNKIEQKQISQILSDIDLELELLKQKLSKYQLAKQGMMQQLLTGKIRLV